MKIGKFFSRLLGLPDLDRLLAGLLREQVNGSDGLLDYVELNRACTLTLNGQKWAVDLKFRKVGK